jgi:indolepyruvate ferredoxin oxidoreductase, beta subunit
MNMPAKVETRSLRRKPLTLLIAALGGQGGGVLADWIGYAARAQGLRVQATSTPGVSQRTGATNFYIELVAMPEEGEAAPVLALSAVPGCVDVLVCAELLEAARMLERGMSTPSRTTLIASTHRVYTTLEKMDGGDGRFDSGRIVEAVRTLARRSVLFDMEAVGARHGVAISAALFGALAGSGSTPLTRRACEDAIRAVGKGVDSSLAAFVQAYERAEQDDRAADVDTGVPLAGHNAAVRAEPTLPPALASRIAALPRRVAEFAREGVLRSLSYQDLRYAGRYLDRIDRIVRDETAAGGPYASHEVAREVARFLALWMCYGDAIHVASLKARASRLERIRREARARDGDVVHIYDLFKPSALEIAAILPRRLGTWLERRAGAKSRLSAGGKGMSLQPASLSGALALRLIAALRPLRPYSLRFAREQEAIDDWLAAVGQELATGRGAVDLTLELAQLPRLLKGYGDTHGSGVEDFRRILDAHRAGTGSDPAYAAAALRVAVRTALAKGDTQQPPATGATARAQPIFWSKPPGL